MPVQIFAPMTKDFPSFDCDAHVTEPPWLWERAKGWLTKDEFEAPKGSFWFDAESKRLLAYARWRESTPCWDPEMTLKDGPIAFRPRYSTIVAIPAPCAKRWRAVRPGGATEVLFPET